MSAKEDENNRNGGFNLNKDGVNCLCCKFKKIHIIKKQKTTTEHNKVVVNVVEDRSSFTVGNRGTTPDDNIFKPDETRQIGSIEICDTGFGKHTITPEQNEERIEKIETELVEIKKDVNKLKLNKMV